MKAGETVQDKGEVKVVEVSNQGSIGTESDISAVVDMDYDKVYAS